MKKKVLRILVCIIFVLCLTGCGNSDVKDNKDNKGEVKTGVNGQVLTDVKAKIVNNDGKTEKKSWYELDQLLGENNEYFKKYYHGAEVEITDTVVQIKNNEDIAGAPTGKLCYKLILSSGWYVYLDQEQNDLSDVLAGTKVHIKSNIYDNNLWPIMHGNSSTIEILS